MNKLVVKLKQHTPLIHFQHSQEGATLRASEVKPKLDKYIIKKVFDDDWDKCKEYLIGYKKSKKEDDKEKKEDEIKLNRDLERKFKKEGYRALNYKMRISDNLDNIFYLDTNKKKEYKKNDEKKDIDKGFRVEIVNYGEERNKPEGKIRLVIKDENGKLFYGKWRKEDSKIIYDLDSYPCFFANMGCDIYDSYEYKKVSFAKEPFEMIIITNHSELFNILKDKRVLSSFFLNTNFGTRQSKGFGSFYIYEKDELYVNPKSFYYFNLPISEVCNYDKFYVLFHNIELFTKTLRAGINEKRVKNTVFYFKSLAFMYCKDILNAEWDKKRVKKEFYFEVSPRRNDSLQKQKSQYNDDEDHDILFFDSNDGYDIRDLLGFSTNEEWQSYNDSIEKKVAILRNDKPNFPRKEDTLPVDRMRSPLLIKPICHVDEDDNVSYTIHLLFQDEEVGMGGLKHQQKICFYSKREKNDDSYRKSFMLNIPKSFSMLGYFGYIFNTLQFDISKHIEEKYHQHDYYGILKNIYTQLKNNMSK